MESESHQQLVNNLEGQARTIRKGVMEALWAAEGGHIGGSLSCVDILAALYMHVMRVDPKKPDWENRDRFVLSKGHASAALCPTLAQKGFFPKKLLDTFNQLESPFSMHPDMLKIPGVDMSTGSLGHGLSVGVGMALAARVQKRGFRTYVLMGDGELAEGSIWEAAMAGAHFNLDHLIAIVDANRLQVDGTTQEVMDLEPLADKWRAFGWAVREIDGHDMECIVETLSVLPFEAGRPSAIIAHTVKGKGLSFAENRLDHHYRDVDEDMLRKAMAELER